MATTKTTAEKKPTAAKATTSKAKSTVETKAAVKKSPAKKTSPAKLKQSDAAERYKMTEVAAYYIAERNNFAGCAVDYWIAAEAEITKKLAK
jgi:hypothetical protein